MSGKKKKLPAYLEPPVLSEMGVTEQMSAVCCWSSCPPRELTREAYPTAIAQSVDSQNGSLSSRSPEDDIHILTHCPYCLPVIPLANSSTNLNGVISAINFDVKIKKETYV